VTTASVSVWALFTSQYRGNKAYTLTDEVVTQFASILGLPLYWVSIHTFPSSLGLLTLRSMDTFTS
jgi:hypothetical protein